MVLPNFSKLNMLNFNLKNLIFCYLPLDQVLQNILRLEKKLIEAIHRKKDFKILLNNLDFYTSTINFQRKEIRKIKSDFNNLELTEAQINEILFYLLNRKFRLQSINSSNAAYINFMHCDLDFVCEFLSKKNIALKNISICLGKNFLNENRLKQIFKVLRKSKVIQKLNLSHNALGDKEYEMLYVSKMLEKSQALRELDLSNNIIGQNIRDMEHLANALIRNSIIKKLNLNHNLIGLSDYNVFNICKMIRKNKTLETLDIFDNLIFDNTHIQDIHSVLSQNNTLEHFSMQFRDHGNYELDFFRNIKFFDNFIHYILWATFIMFSVMLINGKINIRAI